MPKLCSTCKHWAGDGGSSRAPCTIGYGTSAFNDTCGRHEGRPVMPVPSPAVAARSSVWWVGLLGPDGRELAAAGYRRQPFKPEQTGMVLRLSWPIVWRDIPVDWGTIVGYVVLNDDGALVKKEAIIPALHMLRGMSLAVEVRL